MRAGMFWRDGTRDTGEDLVTMSCASEHSAKPNRFGEL